MENILAMSEGSRTSDQIDHNVFQELLAKSWDFHTYMKYERRNV